MSIPGMMYPTMKGMPAGNPRDAAITNMNNAAAIQAQANNAVGGRKRRRSRRNRKGGASAITVPQFNMSYEPQGGPGTNPNDQIASNPAPISILVKVTCTGRHSRSSKCSFRCWCI